LNQKESRQRRLAILSDPTDLHERGRKGDTSTLSSDFLLFLQSALQYHSSKQRQKSISAATLFKNDFGCQQYARNQMVAKFLVKGPFFC
jgi:hypothetical protein